MDEIRNELAKSLINDVINSGYVGVTAAINTDGNTAIVGVPGHNNAKGIACIFTRNGDAWIEQAKLLASDGSIGDRFGYSVAFSGNGNIIAIGAPAHNGCKGIVHVYNRSGDVWTEQVKLLASDGAYGDRFGISLAISSDGNTIVIGANSDDNDNGDGAGSAYIFTRTDDGWVEDVKLLASDGDRCDWFGSAVSTNSNGTIVIIGAHWHNDGKGAAYIYNCTTDEWVEEAKLEVSNGHWFGYSVSMNNNGDTAIVGSNSRDDGGWINYAFNRRKTTNDITWLQETKLLTNDGIDNGYYAISTPINTDGNTTTVLWAPLN